MNPMENATVYIFGPFFKCSRDRQFNRQASGMEAEIPNLTWVPMGYIKIVLIFGPWKKIEQDGARADE